jgi:hypothetical protein
MNLAAFLGARLSSLITLALSAQPPDIPTVALKSIHQDGLARPIKSEFYFIDSNFPRYEKIS